MKISWHYLIATALAISTLPLCAALPNNGINVYFTATPQAGPPAGLRLDFVPGPDEASNQGLTIYRRAKGGSSWGAPLVQLPAAINMYTDSSITPGAEYEYKAVRVGYFATGSGPGEILAGMNVPLPTYRGKIILIIDRTISSGLTAELATFESDLVGDGWVVLRREVERGPMATDADYLEKNKRLIHEVKATIKADYEADPANVKAVFLIGRIAVPYSGGIGPDSHGARAFPVDSYYAELTTAEDANGWSDVSYSSWPAWPADRLENQNAPNDGKFDLWALPSTVELQIGRVDMNNMAAFGIGELNLLKRYLGKDHNYRHKITPVNPRAFVYHYDEHGFFDYARQTAYSALFSALPEGDIITGSSYWPSVQDGTWSFGVALGYAGYDSIYTIGSSSDLAARNANQTLEPKVTFATLFGSYFGDWDNANNFLRAQICTTTYTLNSTWGTLNRFHHMALGETIGYCVKGIQNWNSLGTPSPLLARIWQTLMGDPSLRLHVVRPPSNFRQSASNQLAWDPSTETGLSGYNLYGSTTLQGPYALVASVGSGITSYTITGTPYNNYMVRATKSQQAPSGTYVNGSQGLMLTLNGSSPIILTQPHTQSVRPGCVAVFSVAAGGQSSSGNRDLSYQWSKNGVVLLNSANVEGATTPSLLLRNVQSGDAANYSVLISNGSGSIASSSASLTLDTRQGPTAVIDNVTVNEGASIDIAVLANDFDPDNQPAPLQVTSAGYAMFNADSHLPIKGIAEKLNGQNVIRYTPKAWAHGESDTLIYTMTDGYMADDGIVNITIVDTATAHDLEGVGLNGADLGTGTTGGSRVLATGDWELTAVPGEGSRPDRIHYESHNQTGDFEVKVHLKDLTGVHSDFGGSGGLMLRESTGDCSRYVAVGVSEGSFVFGYDKANDCSTSYFNGNCKEIVPTIPNTWIGMQRRGDLITLFASTDGVLWQRVGEPVEITGLPSAVNVGLFAGPSVNFQDTRIVFNDFASITYSGLQSIFYNALTLSMATYSGNSFQFQVLGGSAGGNAIVEATSDFVTWQTVAEHSLSDSAFTIVDNAASGYAHRFYRARSGGAESSNALGYMDLTARPGYNLLACQIDNGQGNLLAALITSVPNGTEVSVFNEDTQAFISSTFNSASATWSDPNLVLAPGVGFFIRNLTGSPFQLRFIGALVQGPRSTQLPIGSAYRSSTVPEARALDEMGYTPGDGDIVFKWNQQTQLFSDPYTYFGESIGWDPFTPSFEVGEGFVIQTLGTSPWLRNFSASPRLVLKNVVRLSNGQFRFDIDGSTTTTLAEVQVSSDLKAWTTLAGATLTAASHSFTDSTASGLGNRFYRVQAGNVRSINGVGFYDVAIVSGYSLLGKQLNHFSGSMASSVMPSVPSGAKIYMWDATVPQWRLASTFSSGSGWSPNITLEPGTGMLLESPSAFTATFVGEIPQGVLSSYCLNEYCASRVPQAGTIEDLGFQPVDGDMVFQWNKMTQQYSDPATYFEGWGWDPCVPSLSIGEGIIIENSMRRNWSRFFSIWSEMQLNFGTAQANNDFTFQLSGGPTSGQATIDYSTDLNTWQALSTVNLNGNPRWITDTGAHNAPHRYYRVSSGSTRSINAIGYCRKSFPAGSSFFCNPLKNPLGDGIGTLLGSAPEGTMVFLWNDTEQVFSDPATHFGAFGWDMDGQVSVGSGAQVNFTEAQTITFVGEVPQGSFSSPLVAGYSARGSRVPKSGRIMTQLGCPIVSGDSVMRLKPSGTSDVYLYSGGSWTLNGNAVAEPALDTSEALFILKIQPATWNQNLQIWP